MIHLNKKSRTLVITLFLVCITLLGGNHFAVSASALQANSEAPLLTYKGTHGVEIRSYVPGYDLDKLKEIYDEFAKNTIGEEIAYLSHINLYPDYPRGTNTVGMWHGEWFRDQIAPGRYIDLFGVGMIIPMSSIPSLMNTGIIFFIII